MLTTVKPVYYNEVMKKIILTGKRGGFALVDDEDYDLLNKDTWNHQKRGYATAFAWTDDHKPTRKLMHRVVILAKKHQEVDHINGNPMDNRKSNLRFVTSSQNKTNTELRSDNKSGYRGVYWHPQHKLWWVYIKVNGRNCHFGLYPNIQEAARIAGYVYKAFGAEYRERAQSG